MTKIFDNKVLVLDLVPGNVVFDNGSKAVVKNSFTTRDGKTTVCFERLAANGTPSKKEYRVELPKDSMYQMVKLFNSFAEFYASSL